MGDPEKENNPTLLEQQSREFITQIETAKRLDVTPSFISTLTSRGILKTVLGNRYPWPFVQVQFLAYKESLTKKHDKATGFRAPKEQAPDAPDPEVPIQPEAPTQTIGEQPPKGSHSRPVSVPPHKAERPAPTQDDPPFFAELDYVINLLEEFDHQGIGTSYQIAKSMNEVLKVKQQTLKIIQLENNTISMEEVRLMANELGIRHRDLWLNWPQTVALEMAEELGVSAHALNSVLDKYIRRNLDTLSKIKIEPESRDI